MNLRKYNDKKGISMAIIVCIGALLIAFSLAMAYTASLMMSEANTQLTEERAYRLAKSFAEVLDGEIHKGGEDSSGNVIADDKCSEFYKFVKRFVGNAAYKDYDSSDKERTVYTYSLDSGVAAAYKDYGNIEIKLYKHLNDEENNDSRSFLYETGTNYTEKVTTLTQVEHYRYTLTVEVIVSYEDIQYSYKTEYDCAEKLKPEFTYNGKIISWDKDSHKWVEGNISGGSEISINAGDKIDYVYKKDEQSVISRTFKNLYEEK